MQPNYQVSVLCFSYTSLDDPLVASFTAHNIYYYTSATTTTGQSLSLKTCFQYGCAALRVASDSERYISLGICSATYRYISLTIARNAQRSRSGNSTLTGVTYHMGSHSVTCHQTQVNAPAIIPASQAGTWFTYPGGMEGWVDLGSLIAARPGIKPTTTTTTTTTTTSTTTWTVAGCATTVVRWRRFVCACLLIGEQ